MLRAVGKGRLWGQYLACIHAYTLVPGRPPAEADLQRFFRVTPSSYRFGLIDSRHRDSLPFYQIWGLGDEGWEDVGTALGCGDRAGGISGRAGCGSSQPSAGDLAAAVRGGVVWGGAG